MSQNRHLRNVLELNLAMLLISTSGALGRYIDMPVPVTIGSRAILAGVLLFLFCKWRKISLHIESKDRVTIMVGGILMGLHWITYFYALRLSNVAIGMISLFTYPVITSLLEPLILKTKFQKMHLVLGIMVLLGIYFLVPDFSFENTYAKAVGFGVISALCYALRNLIMKTKVTNYHGSMLMWYQLVVISVMLLPFLFIMDSSGIKDQWPWLLVLALLTTAIGHTLFLFSLKRFSATAASIMSSVQPVYGIIIGIIFLGEIPVLSTIIGGVLILTSVVIESIRTYR
ncbi:DMT family transporter [Aquimarina sp. 2201CG5-10]|uniref:DMT family transporter n=1 Tax=Aquimarina callyspongiae TaxID=3098150 RepID=UPI002AB51ADA|nr:EamA family transporter [Aquimarina sp. 2201CG5-10]MDY8138926.1 EamA family transporter [Aquimarina sp. 2201CG5-10]